MKSKQQWRGFTLIELVIVICLVGVLASVFFKRVLFYQEMAEKAAMQQVVGALQTALILEFGHRMASSSGSGLNNVSKENPMDWLMQKPANYVGELSAFNPTLIERGNWVFDKGKHELIYLPDHNEYFVPAKNEGKWIRYRVRLVYEPSYRDKKIMGLAGVIISPVEPYQWIIRDNQ